MTNGEFSGSSSSNRHASNNSVGCTDAGGVSGSVSSGSVPYNSAQTNNDAWNDRPTAAVRAGYASEASDQYTNVISASQRQLQSHNSNDVQEYVLSSVYFSVILILFPLLHFLL